MTKSILKSALITLCVLISTYRFTFAQSEIFRLDITSVYSKVKNSNSLNQTISLPMPDGTKMEFVYQANDAISGDFQLQNPNILSFDIIGLKDPSYHGTLTVSDEKLYATILYRNRVIGIYPSTSNKNDEYKSYFDNQDPENPVTNISCKEISVPGDDKILNKRNNIKSEAQSMSNGTTLRTYRLVLVCTGEFYKANGNSNSLVNTLITAIVNGWNTILKNELSIKLNLVQSAYLYKDETIDPFIPDENGGNGRTTQAVDAIYTRFLTSGYDIGHVLHNTSLTTGWTSGGVAGRGVVCDEGTYFGTTGGPNKAAGWSGSDQNSGNGFIQLSVHEIGHQFDMTHTFNGTGESCTDNISDISSYEIGSGTTLMSYNGICQTDNNISASGVADNYYHVNSLERAINYVQNETCASTTPTGNHPPVVDAGSQYTIPKGTPFFLTGSATDQDRDAMTYCWEEYDEDGDGTPTQGFIGSTAANNNKAPLFRSYPPTTQLIRYFPNKSLILQGLNRNQTFEALPNTARTMNFRFTARDNNVNGGGVAWDNTAVTVSSAAGPFEISSLNNAQTLTATGSAKTQLKWSVANTTASPVNCTNVEIWFSIDGGENFDFYLKTTPNDGEDSIVIPNITTNFGRFMIKGANNIFFDINNANISINSTCNPNGTYFTPQNDVTVDYQNQNNPSLDLNLTPKYGAAITKFSGSITTSDTPSNLVYMNQNVNKCSTASNEVKYDLFPFYVSKAGSYTFDLGTGTIPVIVLYKTSYNESDLCNNFMVTNAIQATGATSVSINQSVTASLVAGEKYYFRISSFSSTFPTLPLNYTLNLKTKPSGAIMYDDVASPGADYFYTFMAINSSNNVIEVIDQGSDFRSLDQREGTFIISGISVAKIDSLDLMSLVGKHIDSLNSKINNFSICADQSSNSIKIILIKPNCYVGNISVTNLKCNDNGTTSIKTDDYITFDLFGHYKNDTDTFKIVDLIFGIANQAKGYFGKTNSFTLTKGSAGGGTKDYKMVFNNGSCDSKFTVEDPGNCSTCINADARINEFHYDNFGGDQNEFVEIYIKNPQPQQLNKYFIELYNGSNGEKYDEISLDKTEAKSDEYGSYYVWDSITLQNGSPDGIALIGECGNTMQFVSYEGSFTAVDGKAKGQISTDILLGENSETPKGSSIQFIDSTWVASIAYNTLGKLNDRGACNILDAKLTKQLCNDNGTNNDPKDDFYTFIIKPFGNNLQGQYSISSSGNVISPTAGNFVDSVQFSLQTGSVFKQDIALNIKSLQDTSCDFTFTLANLGTCSPVCVILTESLTEVKCNNNNTSSVTNDDFITFKLLVAGNSESGNYKVSVDKGNITPTEAALGVEKMFTLQSGSAGKGDIHLTVKCTGGGSNCEMMDTINDPGTCSPDATFDPEIANKIYLTPNPVKDILQISANGLKLGQIEIVDPIGRMILKSQFEKEINLSKLNSNLYFIKFYGKNGELIATKRLVKIE